MRTQRVAKWAAVAGAGCVVGAGVALATPALAAPSSAPAAPQYKFVTASGPYGAFARCPEGFTVTGGGADGTPNVDLQYYSKPADDLSGWAVSGGQSYMVAYAVCVSQG